MLTTRLGRQPRTVAPPNHQPQSQGHELKHTLEFLRLVSPAKLDHFPDFLVIAPPKTGTTWLAQQLNRHPRIFVPPAKEIKYFNYFRKSRSLAWYLSFFREAAGRLKGEATPNYALLPSSTIRLIHDLRPKLKLIYLMRDPIDRAWSHARWDYHISNGIFSSFGGKIDDVTDAMWQESFLNAPAVLFGDYLGQMRRWLDVFDRSQVFVGFTEQVRSSPLVFMNAIFDFLGVERPVQYYESGLNEHVNVGVSRSLTLALRDCLRRIYGGRTRQLVDFLRREFAIDPPAEWIDSFAASDAGPLGSHDASDRSPDDLCCRLAQTVDDDQLKDLLENEERGIPHVIQSYPAWNLVEFRSRFYGVPLCLGPVDFFDRNQAAHPEIIVAETASQIRARIQQMASYGPSGGRAAL